MWACVVLLGACHVYRRLHGFVFFRRFLFSCVYVVVKIVPLKCALSMRACMVLYLYKACPVYVSLLGIFLAVLGAIKIACFSISEECLSTSQARNQRGGGRKGGENGGEQPTGRRRMAELRAREEKEYL